MFSPVGWKIIGWFLALSTKNFQLLPNNLIKLTATKNILYCHITQLFPPKHIFRILHNLPLRYCTAMFVILLYKEIEQSRCPSIEERIMKMLYVNKMLYCSTIKKNEIMKFAELWMEWEYVTLGEVSQTQRKKSTFSHLCGF